MAIQYNAATWTGRYSSHTANFCGYIIYNWYPNYSPTQARLEITQCGIRKTSGSDAEWSAGTAIANASCSGQAKYEGTKSLSSSSSLSWGENGNKALRSTASNWYFNKTTSAQNISVTVYGAKSGGSAWNGSAYSALVLTVPALDSHTISYNANGGTGSIESQTKYYGQNLFLSDGTGFSRAHYTLTGWNTAADGSGIAYSLGAEYSINPTEDITLYAQWELNAIVVDTKVSDEWKSGIVYTKVNGSWVIPFVGYIKVNGVWVEITKE